MEKKIVIRRDSDSDFEYGRPYHADTTGEILRIQDTDFTGNRYTIYYANKFYIHNELENNSKPNDPSYNRCITVEYLVKYKDFIILRGLFFMNRDDEVKDDSGCYYIYEPKNNNRDKRGHYIEYNSDHERFESDEDAIDYIKHVIDNTNDEDEDDDYYCLSDLELFAGPYMYIMNSNKMMEEEVVVLTDNKNLNKIGGK